MAGRRAVAGVPSLERPGSEHPMQWLHTTIPYYSGVETEIAARLGAIMDRLGDRQDAAVFVADADDRSSTRLFLTPGAAKWARELLPAATWVTSAAPARDLRTSLLAGHPCNLDLLCAPAGMPTATKVPAHGAHEAGFATFVVD